MRTAILASQNRNKIREIKAILDRYGLHVISRDDAGIPADDIEETGTTFEENSLLKAAVIMDMIEADPSLSDYLKSPVVADDSGLMVDALGGAPSYANNNAKLLSELEGVPEEKRTAHFVTVITLIYPDAEGAPEAAVKQGKRYVLTAKGVCTGRIAAEPGGEGGFGYDPVFIPDGYTKTFAQLGTDFKNTISHRARALEELERLLGE